MRLIDVDDIPSEILDGIVKNEKLDLPNTHITVRTILDNASTVDAIPKEQLLEMYDKIIKTSYDTAEQYPKYKGIMLYEAQIIIDIMKEYLFKENEDGSN